MWWLKRIEGWGFQVSGFAVRCRVFRFRGFGGCCASYGWKGRPGTPGAPLAAQLTLVTLRVLLIKCRWLHPAQRAGFLCFD